MIRLPDLGFPRARCLVLIAAVSLVACTRKAPDTTGTASPEPTTTEPAPATEPTPDDATAEAPSTEPLPMPASPEVRAKSKEHFMKAVKAYERGDFAEALVEYRDAEMLMPRPAIRVDIARCHLRLGDRAEAKRELDVVLSMSSLDDDTRADALALAAEIDAAPSK